MSSVAKKSQQELWEDVRADYDAAKQDRFTRRRNVPVNGAGADFHFRNEADHLRIMEYARDMVRNDCLVGPAMDKLVSQVIRSGFTFDPATGDAELDEYIAGRWNRWAGDKEACDYAGESNFVDQTKLAFRAMCVDGDCFSIPMDNGSFQLVEGHRCRTPTNTKLDVVLGVRLEEASRRRLEYWITRQEVDPLASVERVGDMQKYDARLPDGSRNVIHVVDPKRMSQTRGVSMLAGIFKTVGMHDDIQLANMVKQQAVSSYAIFRERAANWKAPTRFGRGTPGKPEAQTPQAAAIEADLGRMLEHIGPGMILNGQPGETLKGFSPAVPNAEYFLHARQMQQIIGIHIKLPIILMLMDASETNFSGWRGAVDEARLEFGVMQDSFKETWYRPTATYKIREWIDTDIDFRRQVRRARERNPDVNPEGHGWNAPRWSYVQPLQDAQAHTLRRKTFQTSPRRGAAELGHEHSAIMRECVEDNTATILLALEALKEIRKKHPDAPVDWRELLYLEVGSNETAALLKAGVDGTDPEPPEPGEDTPPRPAPPNRNREAATA